MLNIKQQEHQKMENLITKAGYEKLIKDLSIMASKERLNIAKEIEEARGHGDISENAGYADAKDRQGRLESDIATLQEYLSNSRPISSRDLSQDGKVYFGSTVTISNLEVEQVRTFKIVGVPEADAKNGMISYKSPIARSMIGKYVGDDFDVETPGGDCHTYEILEIKHL